MFLNTLASLGNSWGGDSKPTILVGFKKRNSWCALLWSLEYNAPNSIQPCEYSMGGVAEDKAYKVSRLSTRTATTGSGT
ncbi:MAG: hypothetical protein A3A96_02990 [Candidatus Zambryskibacteria bacterium RIFCSPLOWO2_01_FULL_39_39]|uniref:Uncharacterized protein n=1 Tax=Candidatus Zambryskibacteria bacterium RIFCSPLOWO2_01_FULL_39_39 TaxID=1802758 RepID=A0A1G2TWR7_9BACT|nr:MAG: hypothetical protein A3A96_02990 [Candidatus Zambryskibacteria bacterium RIFCSPLOWO2_01_FULL_39_39]